MKSYFQTELITSSLNDEISELYEDFIYYSEILGEFIVVPKTFQTDFASILRLPLLYLFFGNVAKKAATIHDFLYRKDNGLNVSKEIADKIFYEAMKVSKVDQWRRHPMYWGVVVFGERAFHKKHVNDVLV